MSWGGYCETCGDIFCNECTKYNRGFRKDDLPITYTSGRTNPLAITERHSTPNVDANVSVITGQPMIGNMTSNTMDDLHRNPQRVTRSAVHTSSAPNEPRVHLVPNQRSRQHSEQSRSDYEELRRDDLRRRWADDQWWQESNAGWQRPIVSDNSRHMERAMNPRNDSSYSWWFDRRDQDSQSSWQSRSWRTNDDSSDSFWQNHEDRHYSNWRDGF